MLRRAAGAMRMNPERKMTTASTDLGALFERAAGPEGHASVSLGSSRRIVCDVAPGTSFVLDRFDDGVDCLFVRFAAADSGMRVFSLGPGYRFTHCAAGGWLLRPDSDGSDAFWIPQPPSSRKVDSDNRILGERAAEVIDFSAGAAGYTLGVAGHPGEALDLVAWRFPPPTAGRLKDLEQILPIEAQGIFLWGSHARIDRAADIFRHVIHGAVYDVRFAWPHHRKCCSENEAHAIYVALAGLEQATGKHIYRLIQEQLVLCLLARQAADGGWYHGLWTQGMDCHYRLHASGVHLLLDEYVRQPSDRLLQGLDKAVAFLALQTDRIDAGAWLLHDSLEKSQQALQTGPFKWVASRALGKSPSNMLVLNTHLDSTIAIDRYAATSGASMHAPLVLSARKSTARVLALRTAQWLYRLLFAAVDLTLLPTETARRLSLPKRAFKRIAWKYLVPRLPTIKSRWPRLVMPDGYIDRELSLKTWAFDYHSINVMDLLRHHRRFGDDESLRVALDGMRFARGNALPQRLLESRGKEYALGFWTESLYHRCTLATDFDARRELAEAMLLLVDAQLGMPPSLLGANSEAVAAADQLPCPVASDARLRVANLSRRDTQELLVANPASETIALTWARGGDLWKKIVWVNDSGPIADGRAPQIPPRGFISGTVGKS